jgi:hypothetical protein
MFRPKLLNRSSVIGLEFDTFPTDWPEMDELVFRMEQMRATLEGSDKTDEPEDYVRPDPNEIPKEVSR